ncbi:ROK family protein [Microbacterium sp. PMB16]|uniref:ROK family protein n=1 Tax=Microbacterium sp. PMB16 TaxID=3120157 RepID=UPI003F4BDBCF
MTRQLRIGIDVGGTKTDLVVLGADGREVARLHAPTVPGADPLIRHLTSMIDAVSTTFHGRIAGIGIGIPGLVDWSTGHVAHAVNLQIEDLPLGALLSAEWGVPVVVDNDVNAAALGLATLNADSGKSLGYLNIGTGLAAGIVIDGVLWRGSGGVVGEIGHVAVDSSGARCPCGQIGCLELRASGAALTRALPAGVAPSSVDALLLTQRDDVRYAFETWAQGVADAVLMLTLSVGNERTVIGGGAAAFGSLLTDALGRVFDTRAAESAFVASLGLRDRTEVSANTSAASVGAALLVSAA